MYVVSGKAVSPLQAMLRREGIREFFESNRLAAMERMRATSPPTVEESEEVSTKWGDEKLRVIIDSLYDVMHRSGRSSGTSATN